MLCYYTAPPKYRDVERFNKGVGRITNPCVSFVSNGDHMRSLKKK